MCAQILFNDCAGFNRSAQHGRWQVFGVVQIENAGVTKLGRPGGLSDARKKEMW